MKDKIFLIWSGNNVVATKVKTILEKEKNYLCLIGGSFESDTQMFTVGDTVIRQMNMCNQAIVIFQRKSSGNISENLFLNWDIQLLNMD